MFRIILLALVASCATADHDYPSMFQKAMNKFSAKDGLLKNEAPAVRAARYNAFVEFAKMTDEINKDKSRTFKAENNFLSILTEEERQSQYLGLNTTGHNSLSSTFVESSASNSNLKLAASRDFSKKISPVKDQGSCGSCWTYAATAALEGEIYFTTSSEGVSLSEQEYMECSTSRDGCQGGWMEDCYSYSVNKGRIAPTHAYPYTGVDSGSCKANGKENALDTSNVKITGNIKCHGSDSKLLEYANTHIVSVAIAVVNSFYGYSKDVYNERNCQQLNHAVAVVGYKSDFWYVRNSWGQGWGDQGYIRMSRKVNNICGINREAHIPRVECADDSCTKPDIEDGEEEEEEEEEEEGGEEEMCEYRVSLGPCKKKEADARALCEDNGISEEECTIAKVRKCYYASLGQDTGAKNNIRYYGPCSGDDEDASEDATEDDGDDDDNGGCNADAGLVFCSDCQCCKHKHMCHD